MARRVRRLSFAVASLFGGEKRGCRHMNMTTAVSFVLRASKLSLAFLHRKICFLSNVIRIS